LAPSRGCDWKTDRCRRIEVDDRIGMKRSIAMIHDLVVSRPLIAALVAAGALAFGMQAFAQSTSGDQSGASTTTRPAAAAQGGNASTSPSGQGMSQGGTGSPANEKTIPPSKSETSDSAFKKLDASHKGYVTLDDAKTMPGFERSFQSADTNHDGKLTGDEFKKAWTTFTGNPQ
jgi:hypothetical protein